MKCCIKWISTQIKRLKYQKRNYAIQAQLTRATKASDAIAIQKKEYDRLIEFKPATIG
ncbi:MAG TPA: hypothetical protein VHO70_05420 [Chitinispirillaceae bacterium]|nr:hypothetical protein [Chitinispirillaceae bacterium]